MKKYIILVVIIIVSLASITYLYNNYIGQSIQVHENNKYYEELHNKEITGNELATLINKVVNTNSKNEVSKDNKEYYLNNGTNSIIIEIKFIDSDKTFRMEQIVQNKIEKFIQLYSSLKFKITKLDYHQKTKYISSIYIEQV